MSDVVIEFTADSSRCIGVPTDSTPTGLVGENAPAQLRYLTDPLVQIVWDFKSGLGCFVLDFSELPGESKLALDFKDGRVAAETPLVLRKYTGAASQRWSLTIRPGYITSMANPNLVIDDHYDSTQANNVIWAYPFNGTQAQRWTLRRVLESVAAKVPRYA
ncbi:RICIN domain-containing protein [Burkholderia sp. MS455]|uniref:RICIN domain-containing protein n=1 Tax=Burkholderia sp. MS455 TaxID=2811788 RepID=UPI0019564CC8|nr:MULTISPECIES: RICIN domain-containing protein [Burkholderia]MDR6497601.1 hypothetical protein [Burkholderia ambifaria]QRR06403.1 RICIN domain-containing protein [Burkholderia sp. MS455]